MTAVAVYVIHWNAPEKLRHTIRSLSSSIGIDLRLTVIDNASDLQRSPSGLALPSGVRLIRLAQNMGFAGAAQYALRDAENQGDEFIAVAAHDVEADRSTLHLLVRALEASPQLAAAGPSFLTPASEKFVSLGGRWRQGNLSHALPSDFPGIDVGQKDILEADWLLGALTTFRVSSLRDVGGHDARFFSYWEDVDVCLRLRNRGWRLGVVPAARAWEPGHTVPHYWYVYLVSRNRVLLHSWHEGWTGRVRAMRWLTVDAARVAARSLLPSCSRSERELLRMCARAQLTGLVKACMGEQGRPLALDKP